MKREELTQEYLKECLDYDKDTGIFTWKERPENHFKNSSASKIWNIILCGKESLNVQKSTGYIRITINGIRYVAHRLAWLYVYGYFPYNIDHINGIKNDNRICNLRECNEAENQQNQRKARTNNKSSGLLGVSINKITGVIRARITINKKQIYLGCFNTIEEAHEAYLKAKRELHPFNTL